MKLNWKTIIFIGHIACGLFLSETAICDAGSVRMFDCRWISGDDSKEFYKGKQCSLKLDQDRLEFRREKHLLYLGKVDKTFKRASKDVYRFDGDDAAEPNTYDIFIWIDKSLIDGEKSGALTIDIPIQRDNEPYRDPRTTTGYESNKNKFQCRQS